MPSITRSTLAIAEEASALERRGGDKAFSRARDILRQDAELTVEQFYELDGLFSSVSLAQFTALTSDDLHLRQLRKYEIMAWRHPRAAAPVLAFLLIICAIVAVALAWS